jgi:RNA polymerase sigma-70 factor (ECF subfamily)
MSARGIVIPFKPGRPPGSARLPVCELEDDELMLLARGGKRHAFDELVRRHQSALLTVATRLLGDPTLSRDVAQNAFVEVYRYLPRYEPRGKCRAFLHRILLNQCRMALRSNRYERWVRDELARVPRQPVDLPEKIVLARERRREVERALHRLSKKLRQVVVLRFAGGLSYQEIGEVLDLPIGTVKSRMFAALGKMREYLEGDRP